MKERLYYILLNIIRKLEQSINVERITNNEIDTLFGSASGTGTNAQDYVVEHVIGVNSSDGTRWNYIKWSSGTLEMWGYRSNVSVTNYSTVISGQWWGYYIDIQFPFTLTEPPIVLAQMQVDAQFTITTVEDNSTTTTGVRVFGASNVSGTKNCRCHLHVFSTWK